MNDKVMVAGAGKSGIAAAKLLLETGGTVLLYDSNEKLDTEKVLAEFPENAKITLKLGELEKPDFAGIQICVMSPGIDLETPFVKLLTDNKVQLWSEIELGYQVAKGQLVAVTGTNGKTTTVTLTGQIMKNAFEDAFTVGNIGFPYTEAALKTTEKSVTVLEASSFQLETIIRFHPHVAAITNITPDHLNRHHTMENYIRIKEDITANMTKEDFIVLNYDDEALRAFGKSESCPAVPVFFSSRELLEDGEDDAAGGRGREAETAGIRRRAGMERVYGAGAGRGARFRGQPGGMGKRGGKDGAGGAFYAAEPFPAAHLQGRGAG